MLRILTLLLLIIAAVETAGLSMAMGTTCVERCEDDSPDGQCAPTCSDCVCCAAPRGTPTRGTSEARPTMVLVKTDWAVEPVPDSPEPGDILHIPKRVATASA